MSILSYLMLSPLVGVVLLVFLNNKNISLVKGVTFVSSLIPLAISWCLYSKFNFQNGELQFIEKTSWISTFGIDYHLGVDGISMFLLLLTTVLTSISIVGTWNSVESKIKEFMICILVLEVGMLGVFMVLDAFMFYVIWEVMLIPMYFLIGVWGGENRLYASIKFFLFTMAGSVFMFIAIVFLAITHYNSFGFISFNILDWYKLSSYLTPGVQGILFLAFAVAFAIKIPMFPVHTWLPDAHVQAPTAGSVILAGVLLKMGGYGFIRFAMPLFPDATTTYAPYLMLLSVIGIIYGALVAMIQPDMKKLVAYSSVSHMGFVMLGIFSLNLQGIQGGVIQMLNHGISTGALFLGVGFLYERRHTKLIADYGGIVKVMPVFTIIFMIVTFSSIGLPGLNGFVGEFMILVGAFQANKMLAIVSASGVIFAAVYMLWMCQRVFFGENKNEKNFKLKDLSIREFLVFTPLVFLIIFMGVYPNYFFDRMDASVSKLIKKINYVETTIAVK